MPVAKDTHVALYGWAQHREHPSPLALPQPQPCCQAEDTRSLTRGEVYSKSCALMATSVPRAHDEYTLVQVLEVS